MEFTTNSHEIEIVELDSELFLNLYFNGKFQGSVSEKHLSNILGDIINHSTRKTMETSELRIIFTNKNNKRDFVLNIPIIPAVWDMTSGDDLERYLLINCGESVERVLDCTPSEQVDLLIERNKLHLVNYIRHELAGRYALSKFNVFTNENLEKKIKKLNIMQGYNLDLFSQSTSYRHRYTMPQLYITKAQDENRTYTKYMYMGLQKSVPNDKKTEAFYREIQANDISYQLVDEALNQIAQDMNKWYTVKFMPKITSSLLVAGKDPDQPGGPQ